MISYKYRGMPHTFGYAHQARKPESIGGPIKGAADTEEGVAGKRLLKISGQRDALRSRKEEV